MASRAVHLPLLQEPRGNRLTLAPQQRAVDAFAELHDAGLEGQRYSGLIPQGEPGARQQYAFDVDLDRCSGCKACVTACHSLNGLDAGETWRQVGTLHGGSTGVAARPALAQQTVTASCHHCVEPACMSGCPVGAYEKDPLTGIVKHLDDQCIGCQYCVFTCPYEVPQFNARLGIVRKCDMCSGRLAEREEPACVQGCPNDAIAIRIVEVEELVQASDANVFLPGAPSPRLTTPSTRYRSARLGAGTLLPADYYSVEPAQEHSPLVWMLVLTQLSVGAFGVQWLAQRYWLADAAPGGFARLHSGLALAIALIAMVASTLHLGRPRYAFRALLGLRTSWLSREVLTFGVFAGLALASVLTASGLVRFPSGSILGVLSSQLPTLVVGAGLSGVACSAMLYHATRRQFWHIAHTGPRFFGTAFVLGSALWWSVSSGDSSDSQLAVGVRWMVGVCVTKLVLELLQLRHAWSRHHSEAKRSALLMTRGLARLSWLRFGSGVAGGVVLPTLYLSMHQGASAYAVLSLLLLILGEVTERRLFFAASSGPRMPGNAG